MLRCVGGATMPHLETFSTEGIAPQRRVDYWNELTGSVMTQLAVDPADWNAFSGRLTLADLGRVTIADVTSDPAAVQHSRQHVARSSEPRFLLCLQLEGTCVHRQEGRETRVEYGDFTLFDSTRPYDVHIDERNRSLVFCIPHQELARRLGDTDAVAGVTLRGSGTVSGLTSRFLQNLWQHCLASPDTLLPPRLNDALLDLVASAYSEIQGISPSPATLAARRRQQIREYIETHLFDPDLTPARVAKGVRVSVRYLHQLFEEGEETAARYILRRRLEEASRALADPAQRGRSITDIALNHGFNDVSHFGRVFRERFGLTPGEFRRQSQRTTGG